MRDKIVWLLAQDGEFSVKRAYWFALQLRNLSKDDPGVSTISCPDSNIWKIIWNSKNLPRLSIWTWQAIRNILPSLMELKKRKIIQDDKCSYCNTNAKTLCHILYKCDFAIQMRSFANDKWQSTFSVNFPQYRLHILGENSTANFWKEILSCWKLSEARNQRIFSSTQLSPFHASCPTV